MSGFSGSEVTDVPQSGGERLFSPAVPPPVNQQLSKKGLTGLQGTPAEETIPPQNPMTPEEKALAGTPSETISEESISSIQSKTGNAN
jgi:hypothetical protein